MALLSLKVLKLRYFEMEAKEGEGQDDLFTGLIRGMQHHPSFKILEVEYYHEVRHADWKKQDFDEAFRCKLLHAARGTGIEIRVTYG